MNEPLRVSILVPVMDETFSLRETVSILLEQERGDFAEIVFLVSKFSTPEALAVCAELQAAHPGLMKTLRQTKPYLGGAIQDGIDAAVGTHILLIASDLETDPHAVPAMIAKAREGWDIVATTRWRKGGRFERGYSPLKFVLNWGFQNAMRLLYWTELSDLTYGFRIWKTETLRGLPWEEMRHPFLLECLVRPLRLGATATEIPVSWRPREEGESHNPFWRNFLYLRIAWKVRWSAAARVRTAAKMVAGTTR